MIKSGLDVRTRQCRLLALVLIFFLTTGCATILKGTTQGVPISSDPPGADIIVDGNFVAQTPSVVELARKRDHLIMIDKENYSLKHVAVVKNVGGAVWGNIIAGGLIGWGVDAASGAQNNLTPKTISVKLELVEEGVQPAKSSQDASIGIKKFNDLDQMRDNKQISDEEYTRGRIAIMEEFFPEMIPEPIEPDR